MARSLSAAALQSANVAVGSHRHQMLRDAWGDGVSREEMCVAVRDGRFVNPLATEGGRG